MNLIRRVSLLLVVGLALAVSSGCAGTPAEPRTTARAELVPLPPRDAALIARKVAKARIGAMIRVDRLRGHPARDRLMRLAQVGDVFEGTGVDLLRDASLAFVASTGITQQDTAVLVVHHTLAEERVREAVEVLMERSTPPGQWLENTQVPAARVYVRGHEQVLALPAPGFLVVLPAALADQVDRFAGPLKLTAWEGPEAVVAVVDQPSDALRAKHAPRIPPTISRAEVRLVLKPDGGFGLVADGESTTPQQATADAAALTRSVGRATSVKVAFVRVRFFRKVLFRAENDHVKAKVDMSAKQAAKLLSLAEMLASQRR